MNPDHSPPAVVWREHALHLLDQRALPQKTVYLALHDAPATAQAIKNMVVRGAPAIGIAAAYGVVLAARAAYAQAPGDWRARIEADLQILASARPTAVNLRWAIEHLRGLFTALEGNPVPVLLAEAQHLHAQDIAANQRMGDFGAAFIAQDSAVLTHCNAGALATGGYGTALGVIRSAYRQGKILRVYADETRPWLQGARLTAWELVQENIPVTLLADSAAAMLMRQGTVQWVIVGADRIAANGDVANKIGTYSLAVLARWHGVKFMVAAPLSTFDPAMPDGTHIPIEERGEEEILSLGGQPIAAAGAAAWNPAFDITPADLIDVIVTEHGAVEKPNREALSHLIHNPL